MFSRAGPAIASCQWCAFSVLRATLLAFCTLNAVCAFLFAWMMDSTELVVFRIPALERGWDLRVKAKACRRAGLFFIVFLFLILFAPFWSLLRGKCQVISCRLRFHAHRNCRKVVPREQHRLLQFKHSDSEGEELLEC
ncbi:uncharacterized protein Tco025E_07726 [Trypanosoma conorhini]|uniref:Uncharacterized protein n=1 Tax=Trypanosoma conorhini TaxID=83891 RepID=A0A422NKC6_9TRYP|nr:uncharacterized protein Tco025E_07726 [Trypanosoma conorhini]RNF05779.1 hypothetical protein Tco025E_07726 [Trypanosoma conorhini]